MQLSETSEEKLLSSKGKNIQIGEKIQIKDE